MTYDDVKKRILNRIEKEKAKVLEKIDKASKLEDWEDIKDDITFIV